MHRIQFLPSSVFAARLRRWCWHFWRLNRCVFGLLIGSFSFAGMAAELGVVTPAKAGYFVRQWGIADGLPLDRLTSLAQTSNGYLWIGTDDQGLSRFDGVNFVNFNPINSPRLPGWRIRRLRVDSEDRLWVLGGRRISIRREGSLHLLDGEMQGEIVEDNQGRIFLHERTRPVLRRYVDGGFDVDENQPTNLSESAGTIVHSVEVDRWNRVWAVDRDRTQLYEIARAGGGASIRVETELTGESAVRCLLKLTDGELGLLTDAGLYVRRENEWELLRTYPDSLRGEVLARTAAQDSAGNVWIGTLDERLVHWPARAIPRQVSLELPQLGLNIRQIIEDASGNIWMATRSGLFQFRTVAFRTLVPGQNVILRIHEVAVGGDGSVWLSQGGDIYRVPPNQIDPVFVCASEMYRALSVTTDGVIYGFDEGEVLLRRDTRQRDGEDEVEWIAPTPIEFTYHSATTGLWVGTEDGLYHREASGYVVVDLPGDRPVESLVAAEESGVHGLLVLSESGRVFRFKDGQWTDLGATGIDTDNIAVGLTATPDGTIWVAFRSSELACFRDGVWREFRPPQLALPKGAMGIVSDDAGGLWWNTYGEGVFHLDADSVSGLAGGRLKQALTVRFGIQDGLMSLAGDGYEHTPVRDLTGRIWVPTAIGVSFADPASWRNRRKRLRAPNILLGSVSLDDVVQPTESILDGHVDVAAGVDRVEIDCSLVELTSPDRTFFSYRLVGYDRDWVTVRQRRNVVFQKLPPGNYRFEARAANQYLDWSSPRTLATLTVRPFWWQRTLVHALGFAVFAGSVILLVRRKIQMMETEQAQQQEFSRKLIESQEKERLRVARELHDSLGQHLSIARNTLYLADDAIKSDSIKPDTLDATAEMVDLAIEELRDISCNLRPHLLERLGLRKTLEALVGQIQQSTPCGIRLISEPVDGVLPPDAEIYLYRVIQETLNNIVKHSGATEVSIRLYVTAGRLYLDVHDNGRGFDAGKVVDSANPRGGMGLAGMHERVRILGGTLEIHSSPKDGTEVNVIIPLNGET